MNALSPYGQQLLAFNFYRPEQPRVGFVSHVRKWERVTSERALIAYGKSPVFRDAVNARRKALNETRREEVL